MTRQVTVPEVAIIVAMTKDRVIGLDGRLPWDLPQDRHLFKKLTRGNTVIMGRKTYESINHPLADRRNIVLSRTLTELPGVTVCTSFMAGLEAAGQFGRPVFIIGGAGLYREALPVAEVLHISWIKQPFAGSVHFPDFALVDWTAAEQKDYPGFLYVRYLRQTTEPLHL